MSSLLPDSNSQPIPVHPSQIPYVTMMSHMLQEAGTLLASASPRVIIWHFVNDTSKIAL